MAGEAAGANQGAAQEHLSDGQSNGVGAPKAPEVVNKPIDNPNGSGDGVQPNDTTNPTDKPDEQVPADKKDDTVAQEEKDKDKPVVTEWPTFDDPSAAAAVELLSEAGVSPVEGGEIFNKAIESGDLRDIDVKALEAKVGKTKALLIMNGIKEYHQRTTVENTATVTAVHEVFGGQAGWETVRNWAQAKEKVDPAFKKELDGIRKDLDKGKRAATSAARDLLALYNGNPNTKGLGNGNQVRGEGRAAPVGQPLSRADYLTELKKAHASGATPTAIAQLDARRMAGKKAGI